MNEGKEREAFEKWCDRPDVSLLTDCFGPAYYYSRTGIAWAAWQARAAAPPPPVQGEVRVKPLEWCGRTGGIYFSATSLVGTYTVHKSGRWFACLEGRSFGATAFETREAAQAACRADYARRIRSALIEPGPAPAGVNAERLREENERLHEAMKNMGDALLDFAKGRDRDSIKREAAHEAALLIESMISSPEYAKRPDSRMALAIAARNVRRGRALIASEQIANLAKAMQDFDEAAAIPDVSKQEGE